jgi:hypothetical protein
MHARRAVVGACAMQQLNMALAQETVVSVRPGNHQYQQGSQPQPQPHCSEVTESEPAGMAKTTCLPCPRVVWDVPTAANACNEVDLPQGVRCRRLVSSPIHTHLDFACKI